MLCLAAAALLALGAQPASAAKKKTAKPGKVKTARATRSTTVNGQIVTAKATCPKGTTAVGGGFFSGSSSTITPGLSLLSDWLFISESSRASARSWRVTAYRLDIGAAGPSLPVTAEAYCRSNPGKISTTRASDSVSGDPGLFAPVAACPVGRSAVSGGFLASFVNPPVGGVLLIGGGPVGSVGWQQTGVGESAGSVSAALESQVHCMKRKKAPVTRTAAIAVHPEDVLTGTPEALSSAVTPACPAKLIPFGGGYSGPNVATALPLESRRSGSSWRVSAVVNLGLGGEGQLTVTGVCS